MPTIDFIGIGAQKAGTTWLYHRLNELPSFSMLPQKELHYFDRDSKYPSTNILQESSLIERKKNDKWFQNSKQHIQNLERAGLIEKANWWRKWFYGNYSDEWYLSLFEDAKGLKGEITPSYSFLEVEEIKQMYALAPNAKIIFLIRNTIERAWSCLLYTSPSPRDA